MNSKTNKKLIAVIATVLIISSSLLSSGVIAQGVESLKGMFSSVITIFSNNQQVNLGYDESSGRAYKPVIVDNRVYVPVRALSEVLGKNVNWDGANNRIDITDNQEQDVNYLLQQMVQRQEQIKQLEAKVKELEEKLENAEASSKTTLSELEKQLNKDYGDYKRVYFDIELSGNEKSIKVKIYESKSGYYGYDSLTTSEVKKYITDIVDDIEYSFNKADISGYIENTNRKEVAEFYINSSGKLVVDTNYSSGSGSSYYLEDLEDDLYYDFGSYKGIKFTFEVKGSTSNITVYAYVDERDWDYLHPNEQRDFVNDIYDEVEYQFPNASVSVYVYDYYDDYKLY